MKLEDNRQEIEEQHIYLSLKPIYVSLGRPCQLTYINDSKAYGFFGGVGNKKPQILLYNFCLENSRYVESKKYVPINSIKHFTIKNFQQKQKKFSKHRLDAKKGQNEINSKNSSQNSFTFDQSNMILGSDQATNQLNMVQVGNQLSSAFMTDQQISEIKYIANHAQKDEKQLQRWSTDEKIIAETLDDFESNDVEFDQFAANAKLNHEMEDFNEDDYTTQIDYSQFTKEQIKLAIKQEQEIQNQKYDDFGDNRHMQEERNQIELRDNDENEEALYSQVLKEEKKNVKNILKKHKKILFRKKSIQNKPKTIFNYVKNKWNNEYKITKGQELLDSISTYRKQDKHNHSSFQDSFANQSNMQQSFFEQTQFSMVQNNQFYQSPQIQQQIYHQNNYQQQLVAIYERKTVQATYTCPIVLQTLIK